ncbi:MAG TPA: acyl-CoA dehydrogenase family protein [Acidimicrobiales bacterium]|nr:acyl-CoA dehydrogenase family protein [Acidimicrobiales bacterium]
MAPTAEHTPEHDALRMLVREFAAAEIAPHAEAWDRDHHFPVEVVQAMGDLGLFGLPFPEHYGGSGGDFTALCIAIEELARVDHSMAITLSAGVGLGATPIFLFGTEEQKQTWLPDLCAGRTLAAFGLTEAGGGSDAGATRTTATLEGGEWVLDGEKTFITNSGTPITSVVTVTANTAVNEVSTILVPAGTPGFTVDPPYRKLGWHASDTHGLSFAGCRVPEANLLGERGRGFANFLAVLDKGRIAIAALALGCIEACLAATVDHAKERHAFGRPIGANQAVAFKCADLRVMAETSRHLVYGAAALVDAGRPHKLEAAIAKVHATEAAVTATREATQIFGGYGFVEETPVARFYRDAKILEIGEGTSEVQRLVISRELGLPVQ